MPKSPAPLVSVLIPTHNRENMLGDAVSSALSQTYAPLEIIILDNASKDNTSSVATAFTRQDQRVRYVRHENDLGITGNWRYGLTAARGEFFCLLHDDDTIETRFVESLVQPLLLDSTLALSFCEHRIMDKDGRLLEDDSHRTRFKRQHMAAGTLRDELLTRAILFDYSVPVGCSLFRRSMVPPEFIDDRAKGSIDYWLLYRILQTGASAYYIHDRLMNYRVHSGGMSSSARAYMAEGQIFRLQKLLADPLFVAYHSELAAVSRQTQTDYGIELTQLGRRAEARCVLLNALQDQPSLRTLAVLAFTFGGAMGSRLLKLLRDRAN